MFYDFNKKRTIDSLQRYWYDLYSEAETSFYQANCNLFNSDFTFWWKKVQLIIFNHILPVIFRKYTFTDNIMFPNI